MTQNLLLIDDTKVHLDELEKALQGVLAKKEGEIRRWVPSKGEDPKTAVRRGG